MQAGWVKIGDLRQITCYNSKTLTVASIVNLVWLQVYHTERVSVHLCLQHVCCDAALRAGSSARADTCFSDVGSGLGCWRSGARFNERLNLL